MLSETKFDKAVEAIYGAAASPEAWPATLAAIAEVFDDVGANLTYFRDDGTVGAIVSPSLAGSIDEYREKWAHQDIRTARAVERFLFLGRDVLTDRDFVSDEEIATHPFYTEFLAKLGLRWAAAISISPDPHTNVGITVQRAAAKPPFSEEELATLARLGRHAEQALRLSLRLMDADVARLGLEEALARLGIGVFLLDALGRIVFANAAAERQLGSGLEQIGDRLVADGARRAEFQQAVDAVTSLASQNLESTIAPFVLPRPGAERPLIVHLLPLGTGVDPAVQQFLVRVRAVVLVVGLDAPASADPALVRDALGLTLGEARVAALIGTGLPTREVSARLGITEETVRTVLKRVFGKTHVSRQSELAALLHRVAMGAGIS